MKVDSYGMRKIYTSKKSGAYETFHSYLISTILINKNKNINFNLKYFHATLSHHTLFRHNEALLPKLSWKDIDKKKCGHDSCHSNRRISGMIH